MNRCIEPGCKRARVGAYSRCHAHMEALWRRLFGAGR